MVNRHCHRDTGLHLLRHSLHNMLISQSFCDVSVTVVEEEESKTFRAHKVILAAAFPNLMAKLCADAAVASPEATEDQVKIEGNPRSFEILLNYVYSGVLEFTDSDTADMDRMCVSVGISSKQVLALEDDCYCCNNRDHTIIHPDFIKTENEEEEQWTDSNAGLMIPELMMEEKMEEEDLEEDEEEEAEEVMVAEKKEKKRKKRPKRFGASDKKKHLCSLCGTTLSGTSAYKRHLIIHSGARPFACETCGKDFTQKQRLVVHQRKHTGERPYLCSLCGKNFTESCKLKRHLAKVHKANKDGTELVPGHAVINTDKDMTKRIKPNPSLVRKSRLKV